MHYQVTTPVYQGPLQELWDLVSADRVDLWEISLAQVVEGFLSYCASLEDLDLSTASEFALIASMLVELKCRRMLPRQDQPEPDEELSGGAERDSLLARLLECATFRQAGAALGTLVAEASRSVARLSPREDLPPTAPPDWLSAIDAQAVARAFAELLARPAEQVVDLGHVTAPFPSVEDAAERIVARLAGEGRASFSQLAGSGGRREMVVAFLAVLELSKQGRLELSQQEAFGEISCEWLGSGSVWELDEQAERIGA